MSSEIDELAEKIVNLEPKLQEQLLETVAELNFQRGLRKLSQKYRERLELEKRLDESAEEILAQLRQSREEIAKTDFEHTSIIQVNKTIEGYRFFVEIRNVPNASPLSKSL